MVGTDKQIRAVAVVCFQSSAVDICEGGETVSQSLAELWLLTRYGVQLAEPYSIRRQGDLAVASRDLG
jgi:hypothetical protein